MLQVSKIGRYEVVRQTGNHGLGSLYQAFDPVMHRAVMIRIAETSTHPGVSFDQARQAILFDAKQLAHLDHPNIIKFLACEEDDGRPYLVMERFDGKPLTGQLAPERLVWILKKAALALDHAHTRGLIHRNLTPENLLLDGDAELKVTGFEIARPAQYLNSDQAGQDLDLLLDSIHYMSPELVRGDVLDARSDQYSLGVIAWQTLTGALPFHADSPITLLSQIAFEPPQLRGASIAVVGIFERVFSKSPTERFASSIDFATAFESALSQPDSAGADRSRGSRPQAPAPKAPVRLEERKSLVPWVMLAIVLAAIAIVAAMVITRKPPAPQPAAVPAPAPQVAPAPPPVVKPEIKPKPKLVKRVAPTKDTTPEAPKLKPIEPKVVHP